MKDVIQMTNTIIIFSEILYIFLKTIPFSLILQSFSDMVTCNYTSRAGLSSIVSKSLKTCRGLNRKYSLTSVSLILFKLTSIKFSMHQLLRSLPRKITELKRYLIRVEPARIPHNMIRSGP